MTYSYFRNLFFSRDMKYIGKASILVGDQSSELCKKQSIVRF